MPERHCARITFRVFQLGTTAPADRAISSGCAGSGQDADWAGQQELAILGCRNDGTTALSPFQLEEAFGVKRDVDARHLKKKHACFAWTPCRGMLRRNNLHEGRACGLLSYLVPSIEAAPQSCGDRLCQSGVARGEYSVQPRLE